MAKKGRPKARIERGDVRAPSIWGRRSRIVDDIGAARAATEVLNDPRQQAELYRLKLYGGITEIEYGTGLRVARIYGIHDRLVTGARRSVASPSYDTGFRSGVGLADERVTDDDRKERERLIRQAKNDWNRLQACMSDPERAVVEDVCVFDRAAVGRAVEILSAALVVIATEFGEFAQAKSRAKTAPLAAHGSPKRPVGPPKSPKAWHAPGATHSPQAWRNDPIARAHREITTNYLQALQKVREKEEAAEQERARATS